MGTARRAGVGGALEPDCRPRGEAVLLGQAGDVGAQLIQLPFDGRAEGVLSLAHADRGLPLKPGTGHGRDLVGAAELLLVVVAGHRPPHERGVDLAARERVQGLFGLAERHQLVAAALGQQELWRRRELHGHAAASEGVDRGEAERPRRDDRVAHVEERPGQRDALAHEGPVVGQAEVGVALVGQQRVPHGPLAEVTPPPEVFRGGAQARRHQLRQVDVEAALAAPLAAERQVVGIGADAELGERLTRRRRREREQHRAEERDRSLRHRADPAVTYGDGSSNTNRVPPSGLASTICLPIGPRKTGIEKVRPDTTATYCLPSSS